MSFNPFDGSDQKGVVRRDPLGTLAEIKESGLAPSRYGCCHKQIKNQDGTFEIVGCPWERICERAEKEGKGAPRIVVDAKGEPTGEKRTAGPLNLGLRYIKQTPSGKKVVVFVDTCMGYAAKKPDYEVRGILDVIAIEGESVQVRGSTFRDELVPGEGMKRFTEDKILSYPIPFFARPKNNPTLVDEVVAMTETEREIKRRREVVRDSGLGIPPDEKSKK